MRLWLVQEESNETDADIGVSANRSAAALLIEGFIKRKSRDVVTHVASIWFRIPCILDCQGIESSIG
jgi:hypothetical protein